MVILGIHGDIYDETRLVCESNAAVVVDGRLVAAVSEERLSRVKMDGRYPYRAISDALAAAGVEFDDVDEVALAGRSRSAAIREYARSALTTLYDTGVLGVDPRKGMKLLKPLLKGRSDERRRVRSRIPGVATFHKNPQFIDHHLCHAAGAYFCSPFDHALVITLDGGGDGLDGTAYVARGDTLTPIIAIPHFQSPGTMYSAITRDLGFLRHRHEGKVTGLAAYGRPSRDAMGLTRLIVYDSAKHRFIAPQIARHHRNLESVSTYFGPLLQKYSREDLAATVQDIFESVILEFIDDARQMAAAKGFATSNICVAGGCFANVKLNQHIRELPGVANIYVFPPMSDGGLAAGAALQVSHTAGRREPGVSTLPHVYLGRTFSEREMESALRGAGLNYSKLRDAEREIAALLANNNVVGRFNGAMEYGPRALGNRSILAAPFDQSINTWLNKKLRRTEFMPFAPSMTIEGARAYLQGYRDQHVAADFMTITYEITPGMAHRIPAVVHIDNSARPQVVRQETNPSYHRIIDTFGQLTGVPVILNTSFNIHEEPIVYTPQDAVKGFVDSRLDYLAMGPFLAKLEWRAEP